MLSDEQIYECERIASIRHQRHKHSIRGQQITPADDLQWHFARAIEAEVRKQGDELIQQMLESMRWAARVMAISEDEAPGYFASITAARARLNQ